MNGVHDRGGMDGFGRVGVEGNEPVFHRPWERTAFGLVSAMSGQRLTNVHAFRHLAARAGDATATPTMRAPAHHFWGDATEGAALPCS